MDIDTIGDVTIGAHTEAVVMTDTRVKTWGFASGALADALSRVNANNEIRIREGADIRSEGEIDLAAGRDGTDFFSNSNNFDIRAIANFANRSAFPVSRSPDGSAELNQRNRIIIEFGAATGSVKDTDLITTRGMVFLLGLGEGTDYAAGFIPVSRTGGGSSENVDNGVTVNGEVHVGIQNEQILHIEANPGAPNLLQVTQQS